MSMLSRRTVTFGLIAAFSPMGRAAPGHASGRSATAFGTIVSLTARGRGAAQVEGALDASFAAIRAVERSMSLFDPNSELSRFNRSGALRHPSPLFLSALREAGRAWKLTAGAFDPTVQPLWEVWSRREGGGPGEALLAAARTRVGFERLRLDGSAQGGQQVTLNGIAQGLAADLVADIMRRRGIESAFIDTGEIGAAGDGGALESLVSVRDPRESASAVGFVAPGRRFLATSGDYAAAFSADFSAHHIFDPRTGFSPRELASATVLAPTGAMADALATAFMVTGRDAALRLARETEGVDALLISKSGDIAMSAGMRSLFCQT